MGAGVKRAMRWIVALVLFGCAAGVCAAQSTAREAEAEAAALREAAEWVRTTPPLKGNYEYFMTGRVRFVFFWVGRDDVGQGTIRRGPVPGDAQREMISLLIGSDPAKAPRRINRWGAATEVVKRGSNGRVEASAFAGFMTQASGEATAAEIQQQMADEKAGRTFRYHAMISMLGPEIGIAKRVPVALEKEMDIHQLESVKARVFSEFDSTPGRLRTTEPRMRQRCPRLSGFLATVAELVDAAIERGQMRGSLCYLHYGELYTLRLADARRVTEKKISLEMRDKSKFEHTYRNLLDLEFEITNHQTGKKTDFSLLMGTEGELRGAPVIITYQPNWWFQVILYLKPPAAGAVGALRH